MITSVCLSVFFFNDTATTEIYTLSLHDALPISALAARAVPRRADHRPRPADAQLDLALHPRPAGDGGDDDLHDDRSEEHTSELQSRQYLVCRLLLEKKKKSYTTSCISRPNIVTS